MNSGMHEAKPMPDRFPALEERVSRIENSVDEGLARIESLIRQQIQDLKTEQLKDIKSTIDRVERDLKNDHTRLADDQRRLWDRLNDLERKDNRRAGEQGTWRVITHTLTGLMSGAIASVMTWLLHK